MIELKQNEKLYYIKNRGYWDSACGLAIMNPEKLYLLFNIFCDLNNNVRYDYQPVIQIYEVIKIEDLELLDNKNDINPYEQDRVLYLNDKEYIYFVQILWNLLIKV